MSTYAILGATYVAPNKFFGLLESSENQINAYFAAILAAVDGGTFAGASIEASHF